MPEDSSWQIVKSNAHLVIISNSEEKQRKIPDPGNEGHTYMAMAKKMCLPVLDEASGNRIQKNNSYLSKMEVCFFVSSTRSDAEMTASDPELSFAVSNHLWHYL